MDTNRAVMEFETELLQAEYTLNTQYSFELAEPYYLRCLHIIHGAPNLRLQFESKLIELFSSQQVSDEPVAYLMHKLRWPDVRFWMENKLSKSQNPIANGAPYENVISAYGESWENKQFYKNL